MSPGLRLIDNVPTSVWQAALQQADTATFFQRPEWAWLLNRHFPQYRPAAIEGHVGEVSVFLPMIRIVRRYASDSLLSMPWNTPAGPLTSSPCTAPVAKALAETLRNLRPLTAAIVWPGASAPPPLAGFARTTPVTHILPLENNAGLLSAKFTSKVSKAREKAGKLHTIKIRTEPDASAEYLALCRRQNHPMPRLPQEFYTELLALPGVDLWTVRFDGQLVAGAWLLQGATEVYCWLSAMDRSFRTHRVMGQLYCEAVPALAARGFNKLNLGFSSGTQSVMEFKASLGAVPVPATLDHYQAWPLRLWRSLRRPAP